MVGDGLRNDVHRVGVVIEASVGADNFHIFNDAFRHMNGAQRHKESTRPLSLLANYAVFEWHAFVKIAGLKASGTETRQDGITILQALTPIRRGRELNIQAPGVGHFLGDGFDYTQALFIEIDENDLGTVEIFSLVNK